MQVNGYQIQAAIKEAKQRRDIAEARWDGSQTAFADEQITHPTVHMEKIIAAEQQVAALQTLQSRYNLEVQVTVDGKTHSLMEAVKLISAAARVEQLWTRLTSANDGMSWRNGIVERTRQKDVETSKRLISPDEASDKLVTAASYARRLRGAVAAGNAQFVHMDAARGLM